MTRKGPRIAGRLLAGRLLALILPLLFIPALALAWPTPDQWIPVYKGGVFLQDPSGDTQGSRNIVADPAHDAAFMFNDGTYIHFRLRLDEDPAGTGGQGLLQSFGWGVAIDTNINAGDYEWLMMVDGIAKTEVISLQQNSVQGTLGDPGDATESVCASVPAAGNIQISPADTAINGDPDYFLDWRFPYATFKQCTGLTDTSPLRLFFGSSPSTNNLTEQGGDLVGGSDLYSGFSDFVTPLGRVPVTGAVRFVAGLLSTQDVTQVTVGQTVHVRVEDADQNYDATSLQTLQVTLTTAAGESETMLLTETGVNTGVFSASLPTALSPPTAENGTLEVNVADTVVAATYVDAIDAGLNLNQPRTDTLTVLFPPVLSVTKTVAPATAAAGDTVTYTITVSNSGQGAGLLTRIEDTLPAGFAYVAGTTTGMTLTEPVVSGEQLTWTGSWTVPRRVGETDGSVTLTFQATAGGVNGVFYNTAAISGSNFALISTGPTAPVTVGAPVIALIKSVDISSAGPGDVVTYAVKYRNTGSGTAQNVLIFDAVPTYTTFVSGSMRLGAPGDAYADAAVLSDAAGDDAGEFNGTDVVFNISSVSADDGVPDAGPDEGVVYFRVTVD